MEAIQGLRPTPDRARETLFNWLQTVIQGARCLDLFAGSGALSFEALSRGAGEVVMVEQNEGQVRHLQQQAQILEAENVRIIRADGVSWLASNHSGFDIVFLDPPFGKGLLTEVCNVLIKGKHLRSGARVYVECEPGLDFNNENFQIIKHSQAGQVQYMLLEPTGDINE